MATHERVWEQGGAQSARPAYGLREWKPVGTYALLGIIAGFWVLELIVLFGAGAGWFRALFTVNLDWPLRPWSLVTSTLSHAVVNAAGNIVFTHLLFNGLFLYFFGPTVERLLGTKRFLWLFMIAGAVSGVLQVHLQAAVDLWRGGFDWTQGLVPGRDIGANGALGASGSLMMLFGVLFALAPKMRVMLLFPPVPLPLWVIGAGYVVMDLLGALTPGGNIGNFAHLSGMALGLLYGFRMKKTLAARGMRLQYG